MRIKAIFILISLSILMIGCSNNKPSIITGEQVKEIEYVVDTKQNEEIDHVIENEYVEGVKGSPTEKQVLETKSKMVQGLKNLEIVKIKTAFPMMMDSIEQEKIRDFPQIIQDLESVSAIIEYEPFKKDIITVQKLLQYAIDTEDSIFNEFAIKILNDLTLFGLDYPYDRKSPKAIQGWPVIFREDKFFNVSNTWGSEYPQEVEGIINNIEVSVSDIYDLRAEMLHKQALINGELSGMSQQDLEAIKHDTLNASQILLEMRDYLISNNYTVEALREVFNTNESALRKSISDCMNKLHEGKLKIEYKRLIEYLGYSLEAIEGKDFNYDLILRCIEGTQETLDDISMSVLGDIKPIVNKRYSGAISILEDPPVVYDWIIHEITGVYPDGGKPKINFFGKALYVD